MRLKGQRVPRREAISYYCAENDTLLLFSLHIGALGEMNLSDWIDLTAPVLF